jgi:hypothetical protein
VAHLDWGTVIPTAITGLVGLAGIGGTLLSARITGKSDAENLRMTISADDRRAEVAEKRRIYAACGAALTAHFDAVVGARSNDPHEVRFDPAVLLAEVNRTRVAAVNAVAVVDLISPSEVAILAHHAMTATLDVGEAESTSGASRAIIEMTMAMRTGLGVDADSLGDLVRA